MESRCQICLQSATKKCTSCGGVFCDLHVRYGGQSGGMYGGDVGYYCDECWEKRVKGRQRRVGVVLFLGIALLAANIAGVFVFRSASSDMDVPWLAISIAVMALMVIVLAAFFTRRR